jgi:prepilin-type N-terminal cleavage/methylation domain-containing protein
MIKYKQNKGFTLVELIVVITILAILWTIAFIALQWYSKTARDSARISDMSRIKSSLELFSVETGKYPEPTDFTAITYSGTLSAWDQWEFWEQTFRNVNRLDKIPVDPVTDKQYTYSTTQNRKEYQVAGILETQDLVLVPTSMVNAWETTAIARITWNYNGSILKVKKWNETVLLASPSIICSEWMTVEECLWQNKLAYNWFSNLPANNTWTQYKVLWEAGSLKLVNSNYLIFEWNTVDLNEDSTEWEVARKTMVEKLKLAYNDTKISSREWIRKLVNVDLTDDTVVKNLGVSIVNNKINSRMITASKLKVDSDSNTWIVQSNISQINENDIILYVKTAWDISRDPIIEKNNNTANISNDGNAINIMSHSKTRSSLDWKDFSVLTNFKTSDVNTVQTILWFAYGWWAVSEVSGFSIRIDSWSIILNVHHWKTTTDYDLWNATWEKSLALSFDNSNNIIKVSIDWKILETINYDIRFNSYDNEPVTWWGRHYKDGSSVWPLYDPFIWELKSFVLFNKNYSEIELNKITSSYEIDIVAAPQNCISTIQDWYTVPNMVHWWNQVLTKEVTVTWWIQTHTNTFICNNWNYEGWTAIPLS